MDFRVEISPQALDQIDAIAGYIRGRGSEESAKKWLSDVKRTIGTLRMMPGSHPVAFGAEDTGREARILLHGTKNRTYKIYYSFDSRRRMVSVFHVRHWARKQPTAEELGEFNNG